MPQPERHDGDDHGGAGTALDLVSEPGALTLEAAAAEGEGGKPRLARFTMVAYTGGPMRVSGWRYPLVVDLAGLAIPSQSRPIRFGHDMAAGVGHTDAIRVTEGQLVATGVVSRNTDAAREVVASAKNGFPWQASIGAAVEQHEFVKENQAVTVNGRDLSGPLNVIRRATLGEISFVDLGADAGASARVAASANQENEPMEKTKTDDTPKTDVTASADAPKADVPKGDEPQPNLSARADAELADARRRAALEDMAILAMRERRGDVRTCERIRDLLVEAQARGDSAKDFELALIRVGRPVPPGGRGGLVESDSVLRAAAILSSGLGDETAVTDVGEQAVEAARDRFGHDMGLQEIVLAAAQLNGYSGRSRVTVGNWREVWAYASGQINAAGYGTVNLPNILGNVANKAAAKVAAEPQWIAPRITGRANHSNFHAHTVCSMAANGTLESVGPGGELKHMSLSEETYTRQVGTRGAVLRLSRTDIINDDLGVFSRNAETLVRKGYNSREKALFTLINASGAGASHFTAARGNYLTGADTAPGSVEAMAKAIAAFRLLEGADGEPIGVEPSLVVCGPANEAAFSILLGDHPALIATGTTNAAKRAAAANIYRGRFGGAPLVSPWVEKTAAGGTADTPEWYLLADPQVLPCYELAYLNGVATPTVEYFGLDQDADTLGVAWRIYWDFGVAAAEWRAGVKSKGEA